MNKEIKEILEDYIYICESEKIEKESEHYLNAKRLLEEEKCGMDEIKPKFKGNIEDACKIKANFVHCGMWSTYDGCSRCENYLLKIKTDSQIMEETPRGQAMEWWSNLGVLDKRLMMNKSGYRLHQSPDSLTGRGIEIIWKKQVKIKLYGDDKVTLDSLVENLKDCVKDKAISIHEWSKFTIKEFNLTEDDIEEVIEEFNRKYLEI